jgi:hypothetical protein
VDALRNRRFNLPNLLKNLQLEELSLVDRPANAQAMVSLFKRDNSEEFENMDNEMEAKVKAYMMEKECGRAEAMKALGYDDMAKAEEEAAEPTEVDTLKADVDRLRSENERLRKGLLDEGYVISVEAIEKKAPVEMIEVGGVSVAKADIPAPVLKALEDAEVAKQQHEIEKADVELTKMAGEALPHFDVDVAKSLMKSFAEEEAVMQALKAADAAFAAAMEEFGKSGVNGEFATAADQLDAMVKSFMDENNMKKSDFAKAYAAVAKTEKVKLLSTNPIKGNNYGCYSNTR